MGKKARRSSRTRSGSPTYSNPLTFPIALAGVLPILVCIYAPLIWNPPALQRLPVWIPAGTVLVLIFLNSASMLHPVAHRFWNVTKEWITSTQTARGATHRKQLQNDNFIALPAYGPILALRHRSGKRHL